MQIGHLLTNFPPFGHPRLLISQEKAGENEKGSLSRIYSGQMRKL
jgi:hypothetical protein